MKIFFTVSIICFLFSLSSAQQILLQKHFDNAHYEIHELEINLTTDKIEIYQNDQLIFTENIPGKKIFKSSSAENYFLIASYQFLNEKVDYPVEIRVFDKNGTLTFPFRFTASFDLPHPLLTINENGILALFDPLTFKVKFIGEEIYKEADLEKDIPFEMEKVSYLEMNEDFLYILTSQIALDVTENSSNVTLYRINISDLSTAKKVIDYNTPTLFLLNEGYLYVSGVKFKNYKALGKTIKLNLNFDELSSNDEILEKIVLNKSKIYAKYFNTIYELGSDLSVTNEYKLSAGERITDMALWKNKLFITTYISGENNLYQFSLGLSVDFKAGLNNFKINNLENINFSNNSLIIHHDSKTIKLQLPEN